MTTTIDSEYARYKAVAFSIWFGTMQSTDRFKLDSAFAWESNMNPPKKDVALAGNRTRASRVAGENSTTEPPMHAYREN